MRLPCWADVVREYVLIKLLLIKWWWYKQRHPDETPTEQLINWVFNGGTR